MDCKNCNTPLIGKTSRATFCNDKCRHAYKRSHPGELSGINDMHTSLQAPVSQFRIAPTPQSNNNATTAEFLLREKISELQGQLTEMRGDKKELEKEMKELTKQHNELQVKFNTIQTKHEQELSGVELSKKTVFSEIGAIIKDREAIEGIANLYATIKNGEVPTPKEIGEAESEEVTALKNFYNKLSADDQQLIMENLYAYGKRPDLLKKQNYELRQIINGQ